MKYKVGDKVIVNKIIDQNEYNSLYFKQIGVIEHILEYDIWPYHLYFDHLDNRDKRYCFYENEIEPFELSFKQRLMKLL